MRFAVGAMLILTVVASPIPAAATTLETRVVAMLSAIESLPSASAWRDLGPASVPVLVDIARDSQQPTFRRARALVVLGYFEDPKATAALEGVLQDDRSDASVRRHALIGLGQASPARTMPHAERALGSGDSSMRQVAIKVLGSFRSAEARALLQRHRDREERPFLRQQVEAALATVK